MLKTIAQQRVFASVTQDEELVGLYVRSEVLTGAVGDERPEAQMMRALASDPPPQYVQVIGPAGAGKTSMILRVLADLGRREATTLYRPHQVLVVNAGDAPDRLASPATFMHNMLQLVASQKYRFASIDPDVLTAAAADETTSTGRQVDHRATLNAQVFSYSAGLKEAYDTLKFGQDPNRLREDFQDVLSMVSKDFRPVVLIDDTEHFVHRGADGGVDTDSVTNLFHHGVRALAELGVVDLVVAVHPKYLEVPEVQDVTARFGFLAVQVPSLQPDRDDPGLAAILTRRLQRHGIPTPVEELVSVQVISQLEAYYFTNDHDLRAVLDLAAAAASAAAEVEDERIEPRHLQPLLDRRS